MKKFICAFAIAFTFLIGSVQAKVDVNKAVSFVKAVTTEGVEEIINANISQEERDRRFAKLFNEALDLDFIGRFVLGRHWRQATPQQRKDFIQVYRELNVKTWGKRFDEFKGKDFKFSGTTPSSSEDQIFVNTSVPMEQGEPAKVMWRVKETNGSYRVVDIVIENVSLAITARNEYSGFIKNNPGGVDALIKDLRSKVNK